MSDIAGYLVELKEEIEKLDKQLAQNTGALKQLLKELKSKYKVDSPEKAKKLLQKWTKEEEAILERLAKLQAKIDKRMDL